MSDASQQEQLTALAEQIRQLGIPADTPVRSLPAHVQQMLADYLNQGTTAYTADAYGDADLQSVWTKVNTLVGAANTKSATTKAASGQVLTTVEKTALDKTGADTTGVSVSATGTPRWVLQQFGGDPTGPQQARIVDEWNTVFGTKYTYDQLTGLPQFQDPTDTVQKVVQSAQLDTQPVVEYSVTLPGNRSYKVSSDQQKAQFGQYGYDVKDVVKLVRWADTFNIKDDSGNPAWQPLASLLKAKGLSTQGFTDNPAIDPETGKPTSKVGRLPHGRASMPQPFVLDRNAAANELSIAFIAQGYKTNLAKYGDPSMAYLASLDPTLADRIVSTGGDVTKLSETDFHLIDSKLTAGAWSPQALHAMNYAGGSGWEDFFTRMRQRTDATTAGGATRVAPDPESVKQAVKDLWRKWFRAEPSEKLVTEMAGNIMAVAANAPKDQSIDVEAQLRKMAEASPDYKTLYGNKQPGQSEGDYQGQFEAASQSLLGNEAADNGSILAGMKTGQYQTTVGSTAASARAWQNSAFLGRLAQASQIVNEKT